MEGAQGKSRQAYVDIVVAGVVDEAFVFVIRHNLLAAMNLTAQSIRPGHSALIEVYDPLRFISPRRTPFSGVRRGTTQPDVDQGSVGGGHEGPQG